ncbi:YdcF family protein [Krasilnikovia sp. M28-CT-15]|uniref:YdcF family protein n=1 Tax=Krasilnikovia sp. M28-CT-15 TaxID=3373540 RepID=UPI00399CC54C
MTATVAQITDLVDATAPGLARADVAILFGSTLPEPVAPTAALLRNGLAPVVVLTGGPNRRIPEHVESEVHARLLQEAGIAPERMLIERESRTTVENVAFARPLIEDRLGQVRTVVAIVKWWHRRALHVLAAGLPSVERIYSLTWDPPARADGGRYSRATWASSTDHGRIEREYRHLKDLLDRGDLPALRRDGNGWTRLATECDDESGSRRGLVSSLPLQNP